MANLEKQDAVKNFLDKKWVNFHEDNIQPTSFELKEHEKCEKYRHRNKTEWNSYSSHQLQG